jgi:hypothetical protein
MTQQYPPPQYQSPQQWGPAPQYQAYGPHQESNGLATGGFVTALVGAVLALVPILGIVAWVISPVGLILSIVGMSAASRRGGTGKGLATAGIVLGAIGLLICMLWVAGFAAAADSTRTSGTTSSTAPSYSVPSYSAPATQTSVPGQYGSGTHMVGTGAGEIAPGTYSAAAGSSACYYERLSSVDGEFSSIIANDGEYNGGPVTVQVKASDTAVQVSGDCVFTRR